jgi:hypothetical protein
MPSWLTQNPTQVYFLLGIMALGLGVAFWTTRHGKYLLGFLGVVALAVIVGLIDRMVVTDHEKIVANLRVMATHVEKHDLTRIFSLVSPRFKVGGLDKKGFHDWAQRAVEQHNITNIRVWDFQPAEIDAEKGTARIEFMVKGDGNWVRGGEFFRCRASFLREADGEWRLTGFELFDPRKDPRQAPPLDLPL